MGESTDCNEDEYAVMTKQIINILNIIQKLEISGEKGYVSFLTEEFAEKVEIFDKINPDDNLPEYVFVLEGYYTLEKELPPDIMPKKLETWEAGGYRITRTVGAEETIPEYDEIKKQIIETLHQPYELKGDKGSILIEYPEDLILTEKINPNMSDPDSLPQYVFILPGYYIPK